jgi:hypothetical protein
MQSSKHNPKGAKGSSRAHTGMADPAIAQTIAQAIEQWQEADDADNQRCRNRFPVYFTMELTPLSPALKPIPEAAVSVVGKDLSVRGISFSHDVELRCRHFILRISLPNLAPFLVEARTVWTRKTMIGLYETGCRLIRKLG